MTYYELIYSNQNLMNIIVKNNIDVSNVRHIELFREYMRLTDEGHKQEYITSYLSDVFNISSRTVFRIIKKMKKVIVM